MTQNRPANEAVEVVTGLLVTGLMAAFLFPIAVDEVVEVDTTAWTDGAAQMWDLMPVMMVLGLFLYLVHMALERSEGM